MKKNPFCVDDRVIVTGYDSIGFFHHKYSGTVVEKNDETCKVAMDRGNHARVWFGQCEKSHDKAPQDPGNIPEDPTKPVDPSKPLPEPTPTPEPTPAPEPTPEPQPEPEPTPAPEPSPEPTPSDPSAEPSEPTEPEEEPTGKHKSGRIKKRSHD